MGPPDSHGIPRVPQYSGIECVSFGFKYGAITRCGGVFQLSSSAYSMNRVYRPYNPEQSKLIGLASSPFARRYLGNLFWFLFPGYLDGSLHPVWLYYPILFRYVVHPKMWVTPFGDPRINAYVLLPVAFRSLSRPSSPYSSIGIRHRPIFAWPYYSLRFLFNYLLRHSAPFLSSLNFMTR